MKKLMLLVLLLSNLSVFAQKEGQIFCEGDASESYFTLLSAKKVIYWSDTYYIEKKVGLKTINDKEYIEYLQAWENGQKVSLFLRTENGKVFQYEECCDEDTLRFDDNLKAGDKWKTADNLVEYEIIATDISLKTPVCNYKNILKLKSTFKNGSFEFYYLKGFGYVGASIDGELISFASAEILTRK